MLCMYVCMYVHMHVCMHVFNPSTFAQNRSAQFQRDLQRDCTLICGCSPVQHHKISAKAKALYSEQLHKRVKRLCPVPDTLYEMGAGETAPLVKSLPSKHEGLSLYLRDPHKQPTQQHTPAS